MSRIARLAPKKGEACDKVQIYTDWANHYLERSKHKRLITDLQVDICDGVLLAEVIQAVTNEKVQDIKPRPRNSAQMVENINTCLTCLAELGVNVDGLSAKDIKDGNLKSILGLFFSLSRFKQQQKQQQNLNHSRSGGSSTASTPSSGGVGTLNNNHGEMHSRLPSAKGSNKCPVVTNPSPSSKDSNLNNLNSGIQPPSSSLQRQRAGGASDRSLSRTQYSGSSSGSSKLGGRSGEPAPSTSPSGTLSGIPKPGSRPTARSNIPSVERPASRLASPSSGPASSGAPSASRLRPASASAANKSSSMLDKFKLSNSKEKSDKSGASSTSSLIRPSTASRVPSRTAGGYADPKRLQAEADARGSVSHLSPDSGVSTGSGGANSPKVGMKAFAKKTIGRLSKKSDSNKDNRDEGSNTGTTKRRSPPLQSSSRPSSSVSTASSTSSLASNSALSLGKKSGAGKEKHDTSTLGSNKSSKIATLGSKGSSTKLNKGALSSSGSTTSIPSPGTAIPKPGAKGPKLASKEDARTKTTGASTKEASKKAPSAMQNSVVRQNAHGTGSSTSLTRSIPKPSLGQGSTTALPSSNSMSKHSPDNSVSTGSGQRMQKSIPSPGQSVPEPRLQAPKDGMVAKDSRLPQGQMSGKQLSAQSPGTPTGSAIPGIGKKPAMKPALKPRKVDSDTQTAMSTVNKKLVYNPGSQPHHPTGIKTAAVRENSNSGIKSDHSVSTGADSNNSSSQSNNSKESNSSADSVIFRPSSCDELESGTESESNVPRIRVHGDQLTHIKGPSQNPGLVQGGAQPYVRNPNRGPTPKPPPRTTSPKPPTSPKPGATQTCKVETTFDTEVRTERHDVSRSSPKETTFVVEDAEEPIDIKPMQPINRLAPYSYLRNLSSQANKPTINMPTFSVHTNLANSASSRLGVNRSLLDTSKLYSNSLKRTNSNHGVLDASDCASESDAYDMSAGYMSDGDILRNANRGEDVTGYMSEGGASLYARRMQQRFREGMQAVKECMQKSNALIDDDSFDDSSSISSGEISDTIAEISTDENLTGSSLSASSGDHVNPYGSLKRGTTTKDMQRQGDKNPYANPANLVRTRGSNVVVGGRTYQMNGAGYHRPYVNSDAKSDIGGYTTELDRWHKQRGDVKAGYAIYQGSMSSTGSLPRKLNGHSDKEVGPGVMTRSADASVEGGRGQRGQKKDSEMNTELSSLMMQRAPSGRGQALPHSGSPGNYGFRRPVSGVSVASTSSNKSAGSTRSSLSGKIGKAMSESGKLDGSNVHHSPVRPQSGNQAGRPLSGIPSSSGSGPWVKASSGSALVANGMRSCMSETESMESLVSATANIQAQIQQARALSMASRSLLAHEHDGQRSERSNSMRSSQSEKYSPTNSAPGGLARTGSYGQLDGPASPTASQSSGYTYPMTGPMAGLSPTSLATALGGGEAKTNAIPYGGSFLPLSKLTSKEDDLHGSSLSLVSSSSSVHSSVNLGILKLKKELEQAQEKVATLTNRLSTNAHVVSAFEQSLSNMTARLQQLTASSEQKDSELQELRATIEALRKQSPLSALVFDSHDTSPAHRRLSSTSSTLSKDSTPASEPMPRMMRHRSSESVTSLGSVSSACSHQSSATDVEAAKKKKKKNWFRSSFGKAFSRKKNPRGSMSDIEVDSVSLRSDSSVPNSPLLHIPHQMSQSSAMKGSSSSAELLDGVVPKDEAVMELQTQLHEKDMKLTDIRLEALSSAHQLEHLKETMSRMKSEMSQLKADNDRLQRLIASSGSGGSDVESQSSLLGCKSSDSLEKRLSMGDPTSPIDLLLSADNTEREGRRITVSVTVGPIGDASKVSEGKPVSILIGALSVSGKTKWDMLDGITKRIFKEYVLRVDPVTNLGLNADSVFCYQIGEITRSKDSELPELLPCGYLVGENTNIALGLKGTHQNSVDSLAFETLIPKSIVQRYISLLLEHRRIILCGPSGTGKTYLAQKVAEYLVLKSGKELTAGSIATFNVDHKSSKELRQYLANIAEQCESSTAGELPNVIILDNLHHVNSLGEVFNGFLTVKYQKCPYIIGTMNQTTCSTTNLQLHHNFRWVLCANHMEPVKGFLARFLRRKLITAEIAGAVRATELAKIVEWMPKVWQHLNKFLETHSSSEVTIGPRLFLSCPMEVTGAQVWFTDLWNYSIVPYLLEAVREGLQLYGRRAQWDDPVDWILETYPWQRSEDQERALLRLRPEDVGYDTQGLPSGASPGKGGQAAGGAQSDVDGDPLLSMLMRLQEAASYSSPQSNDSDSTSLDSHSSSLSGTHDYTSSSGGAAGGAVGGATSTSSGGGGGAATHSSIESTL